ncbi:MAG TPA: hypothetical protein VHH73_16375 [Verrucomicrobiae bacterium]|nr:hypothetical protein [Verrucomicrobiae bacterium]
MNQPGITPSAPSPPAASLRLLISINLLQTWRRLKSTREQSRLLSAFIGLFVFGYVALSFLLFRRGLKFVGSFPGLGSLLTERLLFLLFAFLFGLLLISNLVIGYTNFFRNRETAFLFSLPVPAQTIFRWKFLESTALASWAFLFLIAPLLAAFGMTRGAAWHFYIVTILLVALFIVLPAVAGAWCAVTVARYLDRRLFQIVAVGVAIVMLVAAGLWFRPEPITDDMLETRVLAVLDRLLEKTRFAQFPLLPSYWLSASVLNWLEGARAAASFFFLILLSYVALFGFLAFTRMGDAFYEAASIVHSRSGVFNRWAWLQRRPRAAFQYQSGAAERAISLLRWIPPDSRAMLLKDVRVFWRDTSQWGQTLMLFGLLGVYTINLRQFSQQLTNPFWVNVVSFLNLGACALNLATLTTRFVFPQFSLEGKRLWIVGMAPLGLANVVRAKFWLASYTSLVLTLGLIGLSCHMLRMPWDRTCYFAVAVGIMTFTLNGLAIGLGALYPNFKEDNPGKIVSGFGGTLCLVLSFLYIVASVVILALASPWSRVVLKSPVLIAGGWVAFAALSLALGWLPLRLGLRHAARFEM